VFRKLAAFTVSLLSAALPDKTFSHVRVILEILNDPMTIFIVIAPKVVVIIG